mmetsp:Transcript_57159/g.185749  ORF Transcript_57159/g.185749 Transcript_57159/m.185749 type:complete len:232 (-) Transcript_57159:60-755(-)
MGGVCCGSAHDSRTPQFESECFSSSRPLCCGLSGSSPSRARGEDGGPNQPISLLLMCAHTGGHTRGAMARGAAAAADLDWRRSPRLEETLFQLFQLHDLNGNGWLEEDELVQLNSKVALLHRGQDVDLVAVREKYKTLFREKLNAKGLPVPYSVFRRYMLRTLDLADPDMCTQEMIVEHFCSEAALTRSIFFDAPVNNNSKLISDISALLGIPSGFTCNRSPVGSCFFAGC